jgi:hypothetical protein
MKFMVGLLVVLLLLFWMSSYLSTPDEPDEPRKLVEQSTNESERRAIPVKTEETKETGRTEDESDLAWPDNPLAREILIDPENRETSASYWRDAGVGDWVRFLTHEKKLCIYEVVRRKGDRLEIEAKHFELSGECTDDQPDMRESSIEEDDRRWRNILLTSPGYGGVRDVQEWKLFNTERILNCEHYFLDNPKGDKIENLWCREIRCGGYVFMRRGTKTYILLVDYGDAGSPPKWEHLEPKELLNYWYRYNRFLFEKHAPQEDPPEGEPPEPPEE